MDHGSRPPDHRVLSSGRPYRHLECGRRADTVFFPQRPAFLEGQFKKMELPGTTLTTYRSHNGKSDSAR